MSDEVVLDLRSGVLLGHAWLSAMAERHGYRALFIKGPSLQFHGLRAERNSSDIDVLVDPTVFTDYCDSLESSGWRERPPTFAGTRYTEHSKTFIHENWPCDIDVHRFFPGFISDESVVFDALWSRRTRMAIAGRDCLIPDRLSSLLILSLHALRSRSDNTRHALELAYMVENVELDPSERSDLSTLARRTGSDHTLVDVLRALGVLSTPQERRSAEQRLALREWDLRVASGASTGYMWISIIRRQRGWRRPVTIGRAVWPARSDLLRMRPSTVDTPSGRLKSRLSRISEGLPRTVEALWVLYSERTRRPR